MKRFGRKFKLVLFIYFVFELLFASAPLFGWASLAYILRAENYYQYLCTEAEGFSRNCSAVMNKTCAEPTRKSFPCPQQEQKLNGVYVIVVLTTMTSVPAGLTTEYYGPRVCRMISALLFIISGICWAFLTNDLAYLIYIASLALAVAGMMSAFAIFQLTAIVYGKYKATALGIENGAVDASASVMVIFKLIYDSNVSLSFQWCLTIYCWIVALFIILSSILLVPSKMDFDRYVASSSSTQNIDNKIEKSRVELHENDQTCCSNANNTLSYVNAGFEKDADSQGMTSSMACIENEQDRAVKSRNKKESISFDNQPSFETVIVSEGSKLGLRDLEQVPSSATGYKTDKGEKGITQHKQLGYVNTSSVESHINSADTKAIEGRGLKVKLKDLIRLFFSGIYLWEVWLLSNSMLCMNFYNSSLDNLITQQSSSHNVLSQYINAFGIIQFFGIIISPLMGPYLDGRWTRRNKYNQGKDSKLFDKMKRYATALAITNSFCVLQELISLIPILELQYLSMICQVALRGCVYGTLFSYIAVVMPTAHYGKFSSALFVVGSTFSCIQYLLLALTEGPLNGNPFWSHFGLFIVSLTVYGQSIHCYIWAKRKYETFVAKTGQ